MSAFERRKLHIKELFSIIAPEYDFVSRALTLGRDPAWKRKLIAQLPPREKPVCLDLACGTGDLTFALAQKYTDGTITGVDITPEMIHIAQCRNTFKNTNFLLQDMMGTALEDSSVDIITAGYSLVNSQSLPGYLAEVMRLLKPGGVVAFLDRPKPSNKIGQVASYSFLRTWGSLWSLLLHGTSSIYTDTIDEFSEFPTSQELHRCIKEAGFIKLDYRHYGLGMIELLTFEKRR